ncbi:MAG: hypothetical protein ACYTBJ_15970, partial [Planctomycetota bacterium]
RPFQFLPRPSSVTRQRISVSTSCHGSPSTFVLPAIRNTLYAINRTVKHKSDVLFSYRLTTPQILRFTLAQLYRATTPGSKVRPALV